MSSVATSRDSRFECLSFLSPCIGGGEGPFGGGVIERRDILDAPDGVLYGVSCGVGKDVAAGPLKYSSSLSQSAIVLCWVVAVSSPSTATRQQQGAWVAGLTVIVAGKRLEIGGVIWFQSESSRLYIYRISMLPRIISQKQ